MHLRLLFDDRFDLLVVLYIYRIVRVCRKGAGAARPTLPRDIAAVSAVALLGGTYYFYSVRYFVTFLRDALVLAPSDAPQPNLEEREV